MSTEKIIQDEDIQDEDIQNLEENRCNIFKYLDGKNIEILKSIPRIKGKGIQTDVESGRQSELKEQLINQNENGGKRRRTRRKTRKTRKSRKTKKYKKIRKSRKRKTRKYKRKN